MEVPKQTLNIPRSSLVHKWSMVKDIVNNVSLYEPSNDDYLQKALKSLNSMETLLDSLTYQFLIDQFNLLLSKKHGRRYHKHVLIFAAELLNISPAAYRMVKRSEIIILPDEQMIRGLLTKSLSDDNLEKLKPEQKLVNILFDEVKLKQAIRFIGGHIRGHAFDKNNVLATSALVFELICHHGGPRYILKIVPVAAIKAEQLKDLLMEVYFLVKDKGGRPVSFISDNCPLNQKVYKLIGGPGKVTLQPDGGNVFAGYDYDHIHKNNWITEPCKELTFTMDDIEYTSYWKDVTAVYEEDQKRHSD